MMVVFFGPIPARTMFDWMPDWGHLGPFSISWLLLIVFCFGLASLFVYDPCGIASIPVIGFVTSIGNSMSGVNCNS
jgi:hypothetical protein